MRFNVGDHVVAVDCVDGNGRTAVVASSYVLQDREYVIVCWDQTGLLSGGKYADRFRLVQSKKKGVVRHVVLRLRRNAVQG